MSLKGYLSPGQGRKIAIQENKTATPATIDQLVEPDEGFGALASVTVEAAPLQDKTVAPSATQQVVEPDSDNYGLSSVTVEAMTLQSKNVTARLSPQTIEPDSDYDALSSVLVGSGLYGTPYDDYFSASMNSDDVAVAEAWSRIVLYDEASGGQFKRFDTIHNKVITVKSAATLQRLPVPAGYTGYATITVSPMSLQSKNVSPAATTQTISADSGYDGLANISVGGVSTGTVTADDVLFGRTFARADSSGNLGTALGTMPNNGAWNATINSTDAVTVPGGYHNGNGIVSVDSTNIVAGNIKKDVTILGVTGTYEGSGGGASQFEDRLFQFSATGRVTITHTGTYYGISKVNDLVLSGCTTVAADAFGYNEVAFAYTLRLPDVTMVMGKAFEYSTLNKLYIGTAGSDTAITLNNNAFIGCTNFEHLWLLGNSVVRLPNTASISTLRSFTIHVPADLLDTYKAATNWSALTNVTWEAIA